MQIIQGVYNNGKITLDRVVPIENARVTVVFADEGNSTKKRTLKSKGILTHVADVSKILSEKGAWERAVVESAKTSEPKKLKAYGILNELASITDVEGEKGAWERAVVEKHAKNSDT